jgi:hypothetical protein
MSWEQGPRGRKYYTRTRRVGGRCVREYLGGGLEARTASAADALRHAERQAQAAARRQEMERLRTADGLVLELFEAASLVASAALLTSGFRRHGGEWRRDRRHGRDGRSEER